MADTAASTGARAVDRAAALLIAVLGADDPVSFPELVDASGLPKSTVSRLLSSLERSGLITRTPGGEAVPGPALTSFARRQRADQALISLARPALERLSALTGETINLGVVSGASVVQIDQVDPRFMLGAVNWVDREVPLHCSALGKALLAHGVAVPAGRLTPLTGRSITQRTDLEADLRRTRERGYAVADGELEPGLVAVAAAILGSDGVAIGALSVSGPESRLIPDEQQRIGTLVSAEARALTDSYAQLHPSPATSRKVGAA